MTFRELWNRDIDLSKTTAIVQVCHVRRDQPISHDVKWTLRQLRRHETGLEKLRTTRGSFILDIEQCCSLLTLGRVVWKPIICLDETNLFPNYLSQAFTHVGYSPQQYNWDEEENAGNICYMDARWDAYYLDDDKDVCATVLGQLHYTDFFCSFPSKVNGGILFHEYKKHYITIE